LKPRIRPRARAAPAERRRVRARVRRLEALVLRTRCRRAVTSRPQPRAASMRHRAMHPGHHQATGPAEIAAVPWRQVGRCVAACALALLAAAHGARAEEPAPVPATPAAPASAAAPAAPAAPPPSGLARWLDPATAPFIPIPEFDTEPHNGLTLGVIPTWLQTNSREEIERIIAPDIIHSQYFGLGSRMRVLGYPSADTQWSVVGGLKQRVEREFDGRYVTGQTRTGALSWSIEAIYDRSGTPRFFGLGNQS